MNRLDRLCEAIWWHEGWRPGRYAIFRSIGAGFTALLTFALSHWGGK